MRYPGPETASDASIDRSVGGSDVLVAGDSARVLLVDDDPEALRAARGLLELSGLLVVAEVSDAHEALVVGGRIEPTVVVVDLHVRRSGRFGLLSLLHRLRLADPTVMVVVHTAVHEVQVHRAAYMAGAFAVLRKGGSGTAVVAAVHAAHVAGSGLRQRFQHV
jgi:DNA-binding NarL/FixJ family response regulator